ncbi:flagellar basal body P-ring formation chaperone FlgA [Phenylobacterium sp.]|uniref:flagellar basal body P-ring formation chaperone FlgA n=1 Tax=Phenylobacterium sp. TaxID=1871053 RepID=UPI00286CDB00|nr:flagellar basal body P-ring formation chaperone FlgA [Phenylobacterium sp.]
MRAILALAAIVCGLGAMSGPAIAGRPVTLKADTANTDGTVTLGDLFNAAGPAASVPLATRTGPSVVLNAAQVQSAAQRAGLDWANAEGLKLIVVHEGPSASPAASAGALPSRGNVDVLTYTRSLASGEIVQPSDLVWGKAAAGPADAPSDAEAVIGQAARRALRAGAPVSAHDVGAAMVIKAGETITVTYDADGVSLSLQGRAMASGGVGDTINVQNTASKRTVQALVSGPGQAVVGPAADQMKVSRAARFATR